MKILYKNMGFGGGAPRSLLEYAKVAQKNGYPIIAVGQYTYKPDFYHRYGIKTYDVPYFSLKKPMKNIYAFFKYLRIIRIEKPDLIQVITKEQSIFQRFISNLLNIPTVYTVPGGQIDKFFAEAMDKEDLLVFSEENKQNLINYGYDSTSITVNSNRISFPSNNVCNINPYNTKANGLIKLLFIGRIDSNYNAISKVLETVYLLKKGGFEVDLKVLGDGKKISELQQKGEEINFLLKEKIISFEGFCRNVNEYINDAHIIFGKGRSVIDAIANLRVSVVASETGHFFQVTSENILELSQYNFTGRNANKANDFEDILELSKNISNKKTNMEDLYKNKALTQELYDIDYADKKILQIYQDTFKTGKSNKKSLYRVVFSIGILIKVYSLTFIHFLRTKFKLKDQ